MWPEQLRWAEWTSCVCWSRPGGGIQHQTPFHTRPGWRDRRGSSGSPPWSCAPAPWGSWTGRGSPGRSSQTRTLAWPRRHIRHSESIKRFSDYISTWGRRGLYRRVQKILWGSNSWINCSDPTKFFVRACKLQYFTMSDHRMLIIWISLRIRIRVTTYFS